MSQPRKQHPTLVLRLDVSVLDESEAKRIDVELDGFIVVPDNKGDVADRLLHAAILFPRSGFDRGTARVRLDNEVRLGGLLRLASGFRQDGKSAG